jgi:diguanylate cyclase (GGDEF)-like protein
MVTAFLMLRSHRNVLMKQQELQRLSVTDPLTGIANRRQIMLLGESELTRALRYKSIVSILMIDIDHFKTINDSYGHPTGDRVIQFLAHSMAENLRSFDIVGRFGGEEFLIVLPETSSNGASVLANRLREIIENADAVKSDTGEQVHFTVSIGVASMKEGDSAFSTLLGRADRALYDAKSKGRNKVSFASDSTE